MTRRGEKVKAFALESADYRAEVSLVMGTAHGEISIYRTGRTAALILTRPLTLIEIALFYTNRHDLIDQFMESLISGDPTFAATLEAIADGEIHDTPEDDDL